MINVLADKSLEFVHPEDKSLKAQTTIGFCSLPDWVEDTNFYRLALKDGCIKPFQGTSDKAMEDVLKLKEKDEEIAKLKAELAAAKKAETARLKAEAKRAKETKEETKESEEANEPNEEDKG